MALFNSHFSLQIAPIQSQLQLMVKSVLQNRKIPAYLTHQRIRQIPPSQTQKKRHPRGPPNIIVICRHRIRHNSVKKEREKTREIMKGCRSLKMLQCVWHFLFTVAKFFTIWLSFRCLCFIHYYLDFYRFTFLSIFTPFYQFTLIFIYLRVITSISIYLQELLSVYVNLC